MTDMLPMQKFLDAAAKEYPSLTKDELTALIGLQIEVRQNEIKNEMKRAKKSIGKAKGGNIEKQMELFQDGGLKDEGNTKDPVSGNDVPPGATQEEVRDDIPAQLSEGEFVFPADVVRYIGLEKLMQMRQDAKMGLKIMEDMGQMGNADEATLPDDIPFSIIDIQIEEGEADEVDKKAEGGVIKAANGFSGTTTTSKPVEMRSSSTKATPTGLKKQYTAPSFNPTSMGQFTTPISKFTYKGDQAGDKATYKGLLGGDELTQGPDEYRTFVNDAGIEIQIPFKNGELLMGFTIPEGFKEKTEDPKDTKIQTARTKTARVEQETGGGDDGDSETADLGGARTTIGGVEYAVQYNLDGTVGLQSVNNYRSTGKTNFQITTPEIANSIKQQTKGQIAQLAYGPRAALAVELARKAGLEIPGAKRVEGLIKGAKTATTKLSRINPTEVSVFDPDQFLEKGQIISDKDFEKQTGVKKTGIADPVEGLKESDMKSIQSGLQSGTGQLDTSGIDLSNLEPSGDLGPQVSIASNEPPDDNDFSDSGSSFGASEGEFGGIGDFKQGGLAKRKSKPKKMKRGGLASK